MINSERIKDSCDFGALLYLFSCFYFFLQGVFTMKTNGRGKRFYDRELTLPTCRTVMVCSFSSTCKYMYYSSIKFTHLVFHLQFVS